MVREVALGVAMLLSSIYLHTETSLVIHAQAIS
jgi:hypothetical protein